MRGGLGRLRGGAALRRVMTRGVRATSGSVAVRMLEREGGTGVRAGYAVGRKVGGAVQRNLVRRRLREIVRRRQGDLRPGTDVVVGVSGPVDMSFQDLEERVAECIQILVSRGEVKR